MWYCPGPKAALCQGTAQKSSSRHKPKVKGDKGVTLEEGEVI